MPTWVDLREHEASLNVQQTQAGKRLVIRSLSDHGIPDTVRSLGFEKEGDHYIRSNLRFTLQEIQQHFPKAKSREFNLAEIFYIEPQAAQADEVTEASRSTPQDSEAEAYALGRRAFERGAKAVPALDSNFTSTLESAPGDVLKRLNAWHRGWAEANVAAPIEHPEERELASNASLSEDDSDSAATTKFEFVSRQRAGGRPAATGRIMLMETEGRWYAAIDCRHHQGSYQSRSEPLTTDSASFPTEFDARFWAGHRLITEQRSIQQGPKDSVTTDSQRDAAREMADWALQTILPRHEISEIADGPYKGWHQVRVVDGSHQGVIGIGVNQADAADDLRRRLALRISGGLHQWRVIGLNRDGLPIEEDALGVRALIKEGVRACESVTITPYGPKLALERRSLEYLSTEELQELRAESPAESADPGTGEVKDSADPHVGDILCGAEISAIIDSVPVHFYSRKLSKYDARNGAVHRTYGRAFLDGQWHSLGEAWSHARPSKAEVGAAIRFVRSNPEAFDSDAFLAELNEQLAKQNLEVADRKLLLDSPNPAVFKAARIDGESFELRFKDAALPFVVLVEQQSPGVYMPLRLRGSTGPRTSLELAMSWATRELNANKRAYENALAERLQEEPRIDVDITSFRELFGHQRTYAATIEDLRSRCAQAADGAQARFLRTTMPQIPADLVLAWRDERTVTVRIADPVQQYTVAIRGHEPDQVLHDSLWDASRALGRAIAVTQNEVDWLRAKAARADHGAGLDDLARRYAEFMHSHVPEIHTGIASRPHRDFATAVADKDLNYLLGWLARPKGQNDLSKRFFERETGVKLPRTAQDITKALYQWAGHDAEAALRLEAEKAARREAQFQQREAEQAIAHATARLENSRVSHDGVVKTAKSFIDDIIAAGFDTLETRKRGAVDRYRLVRQADRHLYEISGSMVDYARHTLKHLREARLEAEQLDEPQPELKP